MRLMFVNDMSLIIVFIMSFTMSFKVSYYLSNSNLVSIIDVSSDIHNTENDISNSLNIIKFHDFVH